MPNPDTEAVDTADPTPPVDPGVPFEPHPFEPHGVDPRLCDDDGVPTGSAAVFARALSRDLETGMREGGVNRVERLSAEVVRVVVGGEPLLVTVTPLRSGPAVALRSGLRPRTPAEVEATFAALEAGEGAPVSQAIWDRLDESDRATVRATSERVAREGEANRS